MFTSIILVNYKSSNLLIDCLKSINKYPTNELEIIVVDNASNDNIEALLASNYPSVKFIQMDNNAGFARANNAGIKIAKGEVVLLLNTDTIILNDAINKCSSEFKMSDAVACGIQLLNADYSPQISGNFVMRGGLNYLLPIPYVGSLLKRLSTIFNVKKTNVPNAKGTVFVDWINGAFLMVKKDIIDKVGLMDEDFFLYAEEAEWCSRLKKHGRLCIFGDINILHLQGATANVAFVSSGQGYQNLFDKKGFQIMLSNFVRIRKEFGVHWYMLMMSCYFLAIPFFFLGLFFSKIFLFKKSAIGFLDWVGYTKNVFRLLVFMPKIISNKPYFYKVL